MTRLEAYLAYGIDIPKYKPTLPPITEEDNMTQIMVHMCGAISESDLFSWASRYSSVSEVQKLRENFFNDQFHWR